MTPCRQRIYEILALARPGDRDSRWFDIFIIGLITPNILAIVLESVRSLHQQYHALFHTFEVISVRAQPEAFGSIPAAVWWVVATLTTVDYGDVTPITLGGKIFGVGMVALPAGILASAFSDHSRKRREDYAKQVSTAPKDTVAPYPVSGSR